MVSGPTRDAFELKQWIGNRGGKVVRQRDFGVLAIGR